MKQLLTAVLVLAIRFFTVAQTCTTPGQTPSTAFPVCGTSVFHQKTVPLCSTGVLFVPGCGDDPINPIYKDTNPYWYRFSCFQGGTLGFMVSPLDSNEDYDWQLFDITGHDPNDVFVSKDLVVTGNWTATPGNTGTSSTGVDFIQCASFPDPSISTFALMPNIIVDHSYLLLVSHYSKTQSGYDLSFGGGTALITDFETPKLESAVANCAGDIVRLKLNKKMKCNSIASDGSDFYITPGNVAVRSVLAANCSNGFDADSVLLQLATSLPSGFYNVVLRKGTDGNTLLDNCDNMATEGDMVGFTISVPEPTPMDSLVPLKCKAQSLRLVFRKPMLCSSIAPDGSDFAITGSYPVTISGAAGNCASGALTSKEIIINFSESLFRAGSFSLTLCKGVDGNTLRDECNQETSDGSSLTFTVQDTINADFTYIFNNGCDRHAVNYFHPGSHSANYWQWNLDENKTSNLQNPQVLYNLLNKKMVTLIVSNGFCSDTSSQTLLLNKIIKADFDASPEACPNEPTRFTNLAQGQIARYNWQFGDGFSSGEASPTHKYLAPTATTSFVVKQTVFDSSGCESSLEKAVKVYSSCYLAVPNAFTPNGDGKNDFLGPLNATRADNVTFKVYDRWGVVVYQTNNWRKGWDGTFRGVPQPGGVFIWHLSFADHDTGEVRQMKGTTILIR